MAKLTRYLQKIFANNSDQVGVFGTGVDKETSKNVETLQSADYENGWSSAIITNKNYPVWQERDGVDYGFSYQLAYLMQTGMPEWLSTETYYANSFCQYGGKIYQSLQDNNTNHNPALNDGYWEEFSSGNDKVSKSGGTMAWLNVNGTLQREGTGTPTIVIKNTEIERGVAPSTNRGAHYYHMTDKNGAVIGQVATELYTNRRNVVKLQVYSADGTVAPTIRVSAYADNTAGFEFPKCTTKATTTSSARSDLVAVVTQNYVNGTSWYRVWSDGWIEQGGIYDRGSYQGEGTVTVTLLKTFSDANYSVQCSMKNADSSGDYKVDASINPNNYTTTNFKLTFYSLNTGDNQRYAVWEAKGY